LLAAAARHPHINVMSSSAAAASPSPFVLALGDSLTAGHGLPRNASFVSRLRALLRESFPQAEVHDAGVSGNTTADALARLPRMLASLRHRPDLAIVELGANDLLRGIPPARTRASLSAIVDELERCRISILLATLEPPSFLAGFGSAYADVHSGLAKSRGLAAHGFFPPGVLGHPRYVLADRIHPNAAGIDLAARHMLPAVISELERLAPI
jgi:acyl-CoA thioesterase I